MFNSINGVNRYDVFVSNFYEKLKINLINTYYLSVSHAFVFVNFQNALKIFLEC